jgi:hypothetical protein
LDEVDALDVVATLPQATASRRAAVIDPNDLMVFMQAMVARQCDSPVTVSCRYREAGRLIA